jgi:hypothetical protein
MAAAILVKKIEYGTGPDRKEFAFVTLAIASRHGEQTFEVGVLDLGNEAKILEAARDKLALILVDLTAELQELTRH